MFCLNNYEMYVLFFFAKTVDIWDIIGMYSKWNLRKSSQRIPAWLKIFLPWLVLQLLLRSITYDMDFKYRQKPVDKFLIFIFKINLWFRKNYFKPLKIWQNKTT